MAVDVGEDVAVAVERRGSDHILVKPTVERRVINTQLPLDVKTGLIRSNTRTGRAVQSAGSVILPGDLSDFRSPVRSAIFEALTPGSGEMMKVTSDYLTEEVGHVINFVVRLA